MRKNLLLIVIAALPSVALAYADGHNPLLRSVFGAKETCITVSISPQLVTPAKDEEVSDDTSYQASDENSEDTEKANLTAEGAAVDQALAAGGRVQSNVMALLSDRLQKQLALRTVDQKAAPYRANVDVKITQSQDSQGDELYEIGLDINFQEATTTKTGLTGFMDLYHFSGQTFAASKMGIEPQVYVALDQAAEQMRAVFAQASEYCAKAPCSN